MSNGDGPWTKFQKSDAGEETGPWTKFATPEVKPKEMEVPDAAKQSKESLKKIVQPEPLFRDPKAEYYGKVGREEFTPERLKSGFKTAAVTTGALAGGEVVAPFVEGAEAAGGSSALLRWLIPRMARASGVGLGAGAGSLASGSSPKEALATGAKFTGAEIGGEAALTAGGKVIKAMSSKVPPLAKINKLLGVSQKEIRVGKAPASTKEFTTQPARGAEKAGLDEKALKKMTPLERNAAIVKAKDEAVSNLDQALEKASGTGVKLNLKADVDSIFTSIPDKAVRAQTRQRLTQIVNKALGTPMETGTSYMKMLGKLDNISPTQARSIQRGLDEFADFAGEGSVKTFKDVAYKMRKIISEKTHLAVPDSVPLDEHASDLISASKATQRLAKDYSKNVPENKLRKLVIKTLVGGGLTGIGYEAGKRWSGLVP
jgi:hypothetical protein